MKSNVQVYRDTENKILEILTKCVKTLLFFPLLSRYFRACEIDPLMHNECQVCTCFQALVVWRFCMSRVYIQNIAFNTNILVG